MRSDQTISKSTNALIAIEREYRRTEAEVEAFTEFTEQVAAIDERPPLTDGGRPVASLHHLRTAHPSQRKSVCRAYADTVLATSHCEAEYDESPFEHMAAEFGQDIVINLFQSREFPGQLKQALLDASRRSREQRERILSRLDTEMESARMVRESIKGIVDSLREYNSRPIDDYASAELSAICRRLREFEAECECVATDRQATIHAENQSAVDDGSEWGLRAYLYQDLDTEYPMLSDVAGCCRLLREAHENVENEIRARRTVRPDA
ncbi:DUF7260 family protein [Haladaptatus sp. NG-SE-30]